MKITAYVRPACLHVGEEINARAALATGWGKNDTGNSKTIILKLKETLISY